MMHSTMLRDAKRRAYARQQYLKYLQFTPFKPHADMHNAFKVYSNEPSSFFAHPATCNVWMRPLIASRAQTIAQIHNKTDPLCCHKCMWKRFKCILQRRNKCPRAGRGGKGVLHITSFAHCLRVYREKAGMRPGKVHCNLGSLLFSLEVSE